MLNQSNSIVTPKIVSIACKKLPKEQLKNHQHAVQKFLHFFYNAALQPSKADFAEIAHILNTSKERFDQLLTNEISLFNNRLHADVSKIASVSNMRILNDKGLPTYQKVAEIFCDNANLVFNNI